MHRAMAKKAESSDNVTLSVRALGERQRYRASNEAWDVCLLRIAKKRAAKKSLASSRSAIKSQCLSRWTNPPFCGADNGRDHTQSSCTAKRLTYMGLLSRSVSTSCCYGRSTKQHDGTNISISHRAFFRSLSRVWCTTLIPRFLKRWCELSLASQPLNSPNNSTERHAAGSH